MAADFTTDVFEEQRSVLFGVSCRRLGRVADAEDVVQEAWLRWSGADPSGVRAPRACLIRVVTRLALDRLRHVQSRQESHVGPLAAGALRHRLRGGKSPTRPNAPPSRTPCRSPFSSYWSPCRLWRGRLSCCGRRSAVSSPRSPPRSTAARQPRAGSPDGPVGMSTSGGPAVRNPGKRGTSPRGRRSGVLVRPGRVTCGSRGCGGVPTVCEPSAARCR